MREVSEIKDGMDVLIYYNTQIFTFSGHMVYTISDLGHNIGLLFDDESKYKGFVRIKLPRKIEKSKY